MKNMPKRLWTAVVSIIMIFSPLTTIAQTDYASKEGELERLLTEADALTVAGEWHKAEMKLREALRLFPGANNPLLFYNLGACLLNQGKNEEALETFNIALLRYPESPQILMNRARTYLQLSRLDEAMADVENAMKYSDDNSLLELHAVINFNQNRYDAANDDFKMLEKKPGWLSVADDFILLVGARMALVNYEDERAKTFYGELLKKSSNERCLNDALEFYLIMCDDKETQPIVNQILTRLPTSGITHLAASVLAERSYQHSEADRQKNLAKQYGVDSQTIEIFMKKFLGKK